MNTAASEWAAKVAARNEVETAKARVSQPTFDWTGGGATIKQLTLSAAVPGGRDGKEVQG